MRHLTFNTTLMLVGLFVTGTVTAQQRTWIKQHETIAFDQLSWGEYTFIGTSDGLSPNVSRLLYKDGAGALLVVRHESTFLSEGGQPTAVTGGELSVTSIDTGDEIAITVHADQTVTVVIGTASASFPALIPSSQQTKNAALEFLEENTSEGFRTALARLGRTGVYYARRLKFIGVPLRELFFHDVETKPLTNYTGEPTEVVESFDPNTTPPGVFEQQFGSAYYE
jgi:hypothetical protein